MNLNQQPTIDQLRDLLRGCDDRAGNHVLWVDRAGGVTVSRVPRTGWADEFDRRHGGEAVVRMEPYLAGNGYVGPEAVDDPYWVPHLFDWLTRAWAEVQATGRPVVADVDAVGEPAAGF